MADASGHLPSSQEFGQQAANLFELLNAGPGLTPQRRFELEQAYYTMADQQACTREDAERLQQAHMAQYAQFSPVNVNLEPNVRRGFLRTVQDKGAELAGNAYGVGTVVVNGGLEGLSIINDTGWQAIGPLLTPFTGWEPYNQAIQRQSDRGQAVIDAVSSPIQTLRDFDQSLLERQRQAEQLRQQGRHFDAGALIGENMGEVGGLVGGPAIGAARLMPSGRTPTRHGADGVVIIKKKFKEGWSEERVRAIPKGERPDPSVYLDEGYIRNHLSQFDDGASRVMLEGNYDKYGISQRDGTSFVSTRGDIDKIIQNHQGNPRGLEQALGLPEGTLDNSRLVRVDIKNPSRAGLRMPSGNEAGANSFWIPGGKLPNGALESVIDGANVSSGNFTVTKL